LARQILTDNGAPTTDLRMVLGGEAMASIRGKQAVLFKANEAGTDQLLREGVIGRIMGFNLHESFSIKRTAKSAA
ncbi:P22 coat - protein 5 family protein, partial [Citrobacter freundii]